MRLIIAAVMLVSSSLAVSSSAHADSAMGLKIMGTGKTLSVTAIPQTREDGTLFILIKAFASSAANPKKIEIRGDSALVKTCTTPICDYEWTQQDMIKRRCVTCGITVTMTDAAGKTYRVPTEIVRP